MTRSTRRSVFGPVISQGPLHDRILGDRSRPPSSSGAGELLTGGKRLGGELAQRLLRRAHGVRRRRQRVTLAQTETFGPVVSIIRFTDDEAEAVRIANDTPYGLNAFVHTRDLHRAHRVRAALESGSVWINTISKIAPQDPTAATSRAGSAAPAAWRDCTEFLQVKNIRIGLG